MTTLIFVRHAKTDWNKSGRIQGRSDIPLAESSVSEVRDASERLNGREINAVYSSPLRRAVQTAELLTVGRGLEIKTDERLIERDFGEYDGKTYAEIGLPDHTELFYALGGVKNAEPVSSVFDRARSFITDMIKNHDGETVLVVSHGVCISFLTYALTHSEFNADDYAMEYIKNLTLAEHKTGGGL